LERRISGLDGLRALAIALVLATHVKSSITTGGDGVSIFFVLSGFLITGLLANEIEDNGAIHRSLFYLRRAARLYPALLTMLIVTVALGASFASAGIAATYTTNLANSIFHHQVWPFGHTWSLAEEEQFYLLWPLFLPICLKWARPSLIVLSVLAIASAEGERYLGHGLEAFKPLYRAHGLLIGCVLASVARGRVPKFTRWAELGLAVLIASEIFGHYLPNDVELSWTALTPELAAAMMIIGFANNTHSIVSRLFNCAPVVWMGQRSYGIYLWHLPLILLAVRHAVPHGVYLAAALSFVLAEVSYQTVERPFRKLRSRLHPRKPVLVAA
jgi:peptidoglycan/LPS O-acetylase OafA/YrhL